jgi:peptidoglycan/LPS O-acetylase OafA/YrhL
VNITPQAASFHFTRSADSNYRPDIDGLRAIAVLAVVGYHAFPARIPGGYIGVDIFFVISGYLITDIIFRKMLAGSFTIIDFYERRVRRIFPALIIVTVVTFAIGWFYLPPRDLQSLGTNIAGGAIFIQNIVLLGQVGYFDLAAARKPLLHLWSLGIEEQYYIAWPLILLAVRRWKANAVSLTFVLIIASFWLDLAILKKNVDLAFYLPFTRAWELLVGSSSSIWLITAKDVPVAVWTTTECQKACVRVENVLQQLVWAPGTAPRGNLIPEFFAIGAIAAIVGAVYRFSASTPYPGTFTLVPVLAATLLLLTSSSWINRFFLSSRPMVFIGLISYPLYLWHYPLMAYARILWADAVPKGVMIAAVIASAILAWLTYRCVERPIRFSKSRRHGKIAALMAGMAAVGAVGLIADKTGGLPIRIPGEIRGYMLTGEETSVNWRRSKCLLLPDQGASNFADECSGSGKRPMLFVWGDSYAAALYAGLNQLSDQHGYSVAEYTASACPPLIGFLQTDRRFCTSINDFVIKKIADLKPDVVILHSTWSYGGPNELNAGLQETARQLKGLKIRKIVLLGPVASWKGDGLSANVLDYFYESGHSLIPPRTTYRSNEEWTRALEDFLQKRAQELDIEYISARNIMCNDDGCLARIGDHGSDLTAFDNGHLTLPGALFVSDAILGRLLDLNQYSLRNDSPMPAAK